MKLALLGLLLLASCAARPAASPSPSGLAGAQALLMPGARIIDSRPLDSGQDHVLAVLATIPPLAVLSAAASVPPGPPAAELAIVQQSPSGWRLQKAVVQDFAQAPKLDVAQVGGSPAAGMEYHTGANSQGLTVIRNDAIVFDAVADSATLADLNKDGSAEVQKSWSPFCQSHAASPRLDTVYAWQNGAFVQATSQFPTVIASDTAAFQGAVTRAASPQTKPAWDHAAQACLHDALAYLAGLAGNQEEEQAQLAQVKQVDPSYDPQTIQKAANGR